MDPVTDIVTALALGAAAGLTDVAKTGIKDSYNALKTLIQDRYHKVTLAPLEESPKSKARQAVVKEDLEDTAAGADNEVLQHAKSLLELIRDDAPEVAAAIGVDLADIQAASLRITEIIATGSGVKIHGAKVAGAIEISGVRAGGPATDLKKN